MHPADPPDRLTRCTVAGLFCAVVATALLGTGPLLAQNEPAAKSSPNPRAEGETKEPIHVRVDSTPWERLLGPIGGGLSALAGVAMPFLLKWWRKPRLAAPGKLLPGNTRTHLGQKVFDVVQNCVYLRMRIRNVGKTAAEQCYAVLTDIQILPSGSSTWAPTGYADTLELKWASVTAVLGCGVQVVPNIDYYVDLVCRAETSAVIVPVVTRDPVLHAAYFATVGDYKLTVIVTAAECDPITVDIQIRVLAGPPWLELVGITQQP